MPKKSFYTNVGPLFSVLDTLSSSATRRLALKLFSTPMRYKPSSLEREFIASGTRLEVPTSDRSLVVRRYGSGPLVLLAHGWSGAGSQFMRISQALNGAGFATLVPDLPAHGETPGTTATLPKFIDAIDAIAKFHGPFAAAVGHSFGALALSATSERTTISDQFVLVSPTPGVSHAMDFFHLASGIRREIIEQMMDEFSETHAVDLARFEFAKLVHALPLNTLVIHDEGDRMIDVSLTKEWTGLRQDVQLVLTKGLGHQRILSAQAVVDMIVGSIKPEQADIRAHFLSDCAL